ncbi:MAG: acyl-CoA dehydrogenase family protein, partial [Xanthomonadales bacterium]
PGKKENKLGMRSSDTSSLVFEGCRIPAGYLLGDVGEGFIQAMKVLDGGRISIAALSVGIARGALDAALEYASTREQFGRTLASFQITRAKLADMATSVDAARLLTQRSAAMKDAGVLDLDSPRVERFTPDDQAFLEQIAGAYLASLDN